MEAVRWSPSGDAVRIIDQRVLPGEYVERDLRMLEEVRDAIATLAVRGAPAIGVAGAMGLVASLEAHVEEPADRFLDRLRAHAAAIRATRPTAVNLPWAIDRMLATANRAHERSPRALLDSLRAEATAILEEDRQMCRRIGEHGESLIAERARVLTHCNAGALATGGIGTALAPVYVAAERGRTVAVYADETRPLLQGSRLTAWELARAGIPVTVLTDGMAASLMRTGAVDLCIVGADRIAANGDTANKIGSYALAVVARHHGVPFYVAAPSSTIDPAVPDGDSIVIEQRAADEVRRSFGTLTAPADVAVYNPAFDVTPAALITAFVTDRGIVRAPYDFRAWNDAGGRR
ncbi:MAG: S-methyl-5-thioribose-1-phosphate isomerase [Gemmatimonadaceae bacterium]|nr:S-methyl-5-thioribose-1-phosphate isomerase [Gemmatimonadaceae bacterium]